jgi:tetratricopeptide (TPR) repeat protein
MIDRIKELISKHKYYDAIQIIEPEISKGISNELLKSLITCYVHTKQYNKAEKICDTQINKATIQKEKSDWQYRLADMYYESDPHKAISTIRDYLSQFKTSLHGHALAIRICSKLGMHGEAERYYKDGCEIVLKMTDMQKNKVAGLIAKLHKAYGEYLEKVAEQDPSKTVEAATVYRLAVEIDPSDGGLWYELGKVHSSLGNWIDSEDALQEALKLKPNEPYIMRLIAKNYAAQNKPDLALEHYKKIPPQKMQGYILNEAGQCAELLNALKEAGQFYKQAIEREPHKHYHHFILGKLYLRMGAKAQALEQFKITNDLCRKENGVDHKAAQQYIIECQKLPSDEIVTFRTAHETKKKTGIIARYMADRGFGFIESEKTQYFFHISNLIDRSEKGDPKEAQNVHFNIFEGKKGLAAGDISRI